ncbi:iron chelate uptake ABC transporter family permease subunit [Devosia lacusdianchii]|uniref:iron chelate uptake ABC transporter family permease subunit n=1 Tax=Devosia lacusdianchii TaxID=2917991 RepID=UPI001F056796|nr:iron chelate uptake ABC transporter family permease subunit [Devosia sp. JXJ CY 41]
MARRVATVLQEQASDFGLSVAEIVELGLTPHRVSAIALAATATSTALAAGYRVPVQSCNRGVTFEASPQRAVGGDYRRVLPLSALVGAIFLVLAAIVTRILIPPQDMPIGILTGIIGGLFFIGLMRWRQTGAE